MSTSAEDVQAATHRSQKGKTAADASRRPTASMKGAPLVKGANEENMLSRTRSSARLRETTLPGNKKGIKKGKLVPSAIANVVFGKLKNSGSDANELRRKREDDAIRCGRAFKTV